MRLAKKTIGAALCLGALALAGETQAAVVKATQVVAAPKAAVASSSQAGAPGREAVTAAIGGHAIPTSSAHRSWTTLVGPVVNETYARDAAGPGLGTIVLNAPSGFEFNPEATVTVRVNSQGKKTINGVPDGGTIRALVTPHTITMTISRISGSLASPDTLTFKNIQVRPTGGKALASGEITASGTSRFRGLTLSSGTWGHLQEAGAPTPHVLLADPLEDWDGDGRSNLMEYALGTDPTNPGDNSVGMQVWITDIAGNKYVALGFRQRITPGLPLQYVPEVSGDKQTWFSDAGHVSGVSVTPVDSQFSWVTVRDTVPLTPSTPRFIRLSVLDN